MIPTAVGGPPSGHEWRHEAKLDGFRVQIHVDHGEAALYTRQGNEATKRFRRALTPLLDLRRRAIIDAELVACAEDGQPDFHALLRFGARSDAGLCIGFEGVVSKRVDSPYVSGVSPHWLKTKIWRAANISRGELFERG